MTERGKQRVIGLWEQTKTLHKKAGKCLRRTDPGNLEELLSACQQAAIDTGNYVEHYASEDVSELVHVLEQYCEFVYQLSVSPAESGERVADAAGQKLLDYFRRVREGLDGLLVRTEVVFFPYKASMWDALESIWRAADADASCDVYVVPIPYCDRNADGTLKEWHYEGGLFPSYVPVTDYGQYALAERLPDIAYIHNPYDGYNVVTSVAPDYYSGELKKYVEKLVYVPYYYAGAVLSDHQNSLPPLRNMDAVVLPGEAAVEAMAAYQPREKLLPLGSPKADRMLRMEGQGIVPPEWQRLAKGRKLVMYNVGLSPMLQGRYRSLEKMRAVFNVFKEREDVLVWWRPHPLIKATLHTAAPELLGAYEELEKEFVLERIGIYDTGADSNLAVASTDAFVGDYSSMIYLFGLTGKPIFYVDQRVLTDRGRAGRTVRMRDFEIDADRNLRFVSEEYGLECCFCVETGRLTVLGKKAPGGVPWTEKTSCSTKEYVWSVKKDGQGIVRQRTGTDISETCTGFPDGFYPFLSAFAGGCSVFSFLVPMGEWIYLFPGTANMILKVHQKSGEILPCDFALPYAEGQRRGTAFTWASNYVCAKAYDAHTIIAVTAYDDSILILDTNTDQVRICESCLSEKDFETWVETPLQRVQRTGGIVYEDGRSCCLNDFLDALTGEAGWPHEAQRALFAGELNNADGSCGEKVHEYMMKALKEERNAAI